MTTQILDQMTARLDTLKARGIEVRGVNGQLNIDAPLGAPTNELREQFRVHPEAESSKRVGMVWAVVIVAP